MAGVIQYGEQGAPYVPRNDQDEESSGKRKYLSKDGKGKGRKSQGRAKTSYQSPPIIPADIWESPNRKNRFGGGPPVGYGAHMEEEGFWETPIYKVHPITQKKEAINGLFFRLWPRHVRVLQKMKLEGWPHVEIVAVAKELHKRQVEEYQREMQLVQQYIETAQQEAMQEATSVGEPLPPEGGAAPPMEAPPEAGMPPEGGEMAGPEEMLARSLSLSNGMSYNSQLENFRGRFYTRDGGASNIARAQQLKQEAMRQSEQLSKKQGPSEHGFSFGIVIKGEAGHEPEMSQKQLKAQEEKDWARKKPGILGGSLTTDEE